MKGSVAGYVQDLIDLVNAMGGIPYAAIVVGFEKTTVVQVVRYRPRVSRAEFVGELNKLIRSGNKPLGLVGFAIKAADGTPMPECGEGTPLSVEPPYSRPFPKYRKKPWVHDRLRDVAEHFRGRVMEMREAIMSAADAQERAASLN